MLYKPFVSLYEPFKQLYINNKRQSNEVMIEVFKKKHTTTLPKNKLINDIVRVAY